MKNISRLLILLALAMTQAQAVAPEYVRNMARGMGNAGSLGTRATGAQVFRPATLLRVGGVLFQGSVSNTDVLADVDSIDTLRTAESASIRITYKDGTSGSYDAPQWLVLPSIQYAMDENNAAASLFGEPSDQELSLIFPGHSTRISKLDEYNRIVDLHNGCVGDLEAGRPLSQECNQYLLVADATETKLKRLAAEIEDLARNEHAAVDEYIEHYFFADLHKAFRGNAVGLRLLQVDSLLIDPSYVDVVDVAGNQADFPGEAALSTDREALADIVGRSISDCSAKSDGLTLQAWILTDVDTSYVVSRQGETLAISGEPYYYVWARQGDADPVEMRECTNALKAARAHVARNAPRTWSTAVHVARISALVRTLKDERPDLAAGLLESAEKNLAALDFATPRAWPKNGYVDF